MKTAVDESLKDRSRAASPENISNDEVARLCKETFSTDSGAALLDHLIDHFGVLDRVFMKQADGVDPTRAAIRDGERAAIVYILKGIKLASPKGSRKILVPLP